MKIGIVNDMAMAREALRRVVASSPEHRVAWLAADGAEAVACAGRDRPDLVLMDLIMPVLDGVEATRRIMAATPCPILIVTSTVTGNFRKVYDAMGAGALDAVDMPTLGPGGEVRGAAVLLQKIATVGKLLGMPAARPAAPAAEAECLDLSDSRERIIAIGSSTGGPSALAEILAGLPRSLDAAVVLIQHVDSTFAPGLARWLAERADRDVVVAAAGDRPTPDRVLLAGTNDHLVLGPDLRLSYTAEPRELSYRPSVDIFFNSLRRGWPGRGAAVLLTGMGRDGAAGLLALRRAGWFTVAQDEATSVIWGMPRAAVEAGAACHVLPLDAIAPALARQFGAR